MESTTAGTDKRVQIGPPRREQGLVSGTKIRDLIFLSALRGQGETIQEQARGALDQMKQLLKEAGSDLDHVAMITVYFQDVGERRQFDEVYVEYFPENGPARTGVQVANASPSPGGSSRFAFDVIAVTRGA